MKTNGLLFLGIICFANFTFPSGKNAPIVQLVNANTITSLMEKYRTEQEEKYCKVQRKMFPLGCTVGGCVLATAGF